MELKQAQEVNQIKVLELENISRRSSYNEKTQGVIDAVSKGKYFFFHGLDLVDFENGIDWDYQHNNSANTYQLYLHSLESVNHLCNYYEETKDLSALNKAHEIINNWLDYNKNKTLSQFCWYSRHHDG